jgi:hypothetical protein
LIVPKQGKTKTERSLAAGTLAEMCQAMGPAVTPFIEDLYPVFVRGVSDASDEVVSNSVFGIGVLVECGGIGAPIQTRYMEILQLLNTLLKEDGDRRTIDNVLGAVCRMVLTNPTGLPLDSIMQTLVKYLPLGEDYEENITVYKTLYMLLSENNAAAVSQLPTLIPKMIDTLQDKKLDEESRSKIIETLRGVTSQYQEVAVKCITPQQQELLQQALSQLQGGS